MNRPTLACPRAEFGPLAADVALAPWAKLPAVELCEAVQATAPAQRTFLRTAHDGTHWRVLFHCEDREAWATLTERDGPLYTEETVEVFFDPVGDLESYYEIEVNPLGTVLDIVFRRSRSGYRGDWAWNCEGLEVAVNQDASSWAAEIAIPFASVADGRPKRARANFCRIDRPSRDNSVSRELSAWSPPGRENFHTPERFGVVEFSD